MSANDHDVCYTLLQTLKLPPAVSSLAFGHAGHLFVGTDDGILRVYDLSSFKVIKAVKNLGNEVSSIICVKRQGSDIRDAWVACGTKIMKFRLDTPQLIQTAHDALDVVEIGKTEDDLINEIGLNGNKIHIAYSTDKGAVGVVDLSTREVSKMKREHTSVCGCVKYIPNRPKELVSGGYDQKLFHFDSTNGNLLSERGISPSEPTEGMSLSPPFIVSTAISSTGALAAGTADGQLWINFAGESPRDASLKKIVKAVKTWDGLNEKTEHAVKIAEAPIVVMTFLGERTLIVSTLKGVITQYKLMLEENNKLRLEKRWNGETSSSMKPNALIVDEKRVIVGGLQKDGSGVIEIWQKMKISQA
ncbi:WD40-repeat-containing domain protein [Amanita muscaria]